MDLMEMRDLDGLGVNGKGDSRGEEDSLQESRKRFFFFFFYGGLR